MTSPPPGKLLRSACGRGPGTRTHGHGAQFPSWTRGKTIAVNGLTLNAVGWGSNGFVVEPQAPIDASQTDVDMNPVPGVSGLAAFSAALAVPPGVAPGQPWSFKLRTTAAGDFQSLQPADLSDLLFVINFAVN